MPSISSYAPGSGHIEEEVIEGEELEVSAHPRRHKADEHDLDDYEEETLPPSMRTGELGEMEAATSYVDTFDLHRRRTLHLTYYRHGDTRERGMALTALVDAYRVAGVRIVPGELPDFLPALLELAAVTPVGAALLAEHRAALETLRADLERQAAPMQMSSPR